MIRDIRNIHREHALQFAREKILEVTSADHPEDALSTAFPQGAHDLAGLFIGLQPTQDE